MDVKCTKCIHTVNCDLSGTYLLWTHTSLPQFEEQSRDQYLEFSGQHNRKDAFHSSLVGPGSLLKCMCL